MIFEYRVIEKKRKCRFETVNGVYSSLAQFVSKRVSARGIQYLGASAAFPPREYMLVPVCDICIRHAYISHRPRS